MNRVTWMTSVTLALALLPGCGGAGAFHQAVTSDSCRPTDADCSRAGFDAPLALGGTASPVTHVSLDGTAGPSIHYESAAPSIIEVVDGHVVGKSEGASALMFVSDASTVLDFLHVWVRKPKELRLVATVPGREGSGNVNGTMELVAGEEVRISAEPTADGQRLLGTGPAEWKIEPPIAEALREGTEDHRRLLAEHPGKAVLTVRMLGVETTLDIVVHAPLAGALTPQHAVATKGGAT
jgi:hypothetical protein